VASHQVEPGVTIAGVGREGQVKVKAQDRDSKHGEESSGTTIRRMLAWMDLEMTGLDPARHVIVEIATLITDDDLQLIAEGPDLVIHATEPQLAEMGEVVVGMHTRSGLLDQIRESTVTLEEAGAQTLAFLKQHIRSKRTVPLCGNSIGTDRRFLSIYLPTIEDFLHYRSVDVSTLKELAKRWNPAILGGAPDKAEGHRAMDDIRESVEELRYYRQTLLVNAGQRLVASDSALAAGAAAGSGSDSAPRAEAEPTA
jgi:oligoribonuclease